MSFFTQRLSGIHPRYGKVAALGIALLTLFTTPIASQPLDDGTTETCTLVLKVGAGQPLHRSGPGCDTPASPASTFKIVLALIGFDAGILTAPDAPSIEYDPTLLARFEMWRHTTDPNYWLENSVIWYSRFVTKSLGFEKFQFYIDQLNYGNRDLTGDARRNNGLTHAWLSSSLKISPAEKLRFLSQIQQQDWEFDPTSYQKLEASMERFQLADGSWIRGKTGTGWVQDADGARTSTMLGWFVGWAHRPDGTYVFVRLLEQDKPTRGFTSALTKASVLHDLPALLPQP